MGKTYNTHFNDLAQSFGDQLLHVKYLSSFHNVSCLIVQRATTKQYIYIQYEESYSNDDDYFSWRYITNEELKKFNLI